MRVTPFAARTCMAGALYAACGSPAALAAPVDVSACTSIVDATARLACYDRASGMIDASQATTDVERGVPPAGERRATPGSEARAITAAPSHAAPSAPRASRRFDALWELEPQYQQPTFGIRAHRPTYFMPFKYTNEINQRPFSGVGENDTDGELDRIEAKFQLSFKSKLAQDALGTATDLWFGYTQTSNWQVYNRSLSSPFRNTDYSAELMLVHRPEWEAMGIRTRFLNLGFVHQSNGRGEPLSRSWNRIYLQAAFQHDDFVLLLKPWYRIHESARHDDNRDISDRIGRGEVQALYFWRDHHFSLTVRDTFKSPHRGSIRGEWGFPLVNRLRGYVQVFSGYGESLIDYDMRQHTIGVGVMLGDGL